MNETMEQENFMFKGTEAKGNILCGWKRLEGRMFLEKQLDLSIEVGRWEITKTHMLYIVKASSLKL